MHLPVLLFELPVLLDSVVVRSPALENGQLAWMEYLAQLALNLLVLHRGCLTLILFGAELRSDAIEAVLIVLCHRQCTYKDSVQGYL